MYSCKVVLGGSGGVEALRCIHLLILANICATVENHFCKWNVNSLFKRNKCIDYEISI